MVISIEASDCVYLVSRLGKTPPKEEGDLKDGRSYCRSQQWWDKYSDEELATMQRREQQLREGRYGAVEWDDLIGQR